MSDAKISLANILANFNIKALNPMQEAALEATQQHLNVMILSATGSGKTLAFLLPLLPHLQQSAGKTAAIVIVPSRELALQIETVFKQMGTGLKITACYGGHKREIEENNLVQPPALIVGTPGRRSDHLRRGNITADAVHTLVLDEWDKLLELGFQEEVEFIASELPSVNRRILTSATEAVHVPSFLAMNEMEKLNFLPQEGSTSSGLDFAVLQSGDKDKVDTLFRLLCYIGGRSAIIFCNHREAVERTSSLLHQKGITNVFYHGAMEQKERESALAKFRNGSMHFLVTTDLAARGLDIDNIRFIIHYHLPPTQEVFTHRNGRTARMEKSGTAVLLLNEEEHLPAYITTPVETITLPEEHALPEKPKWTTLFIGAGKKDKINKVDIVGFLSQRGELKREDIGLIEVKDFFSFAAIRKSKASHLLQLIKGHRLKNKKINIDIAK